MIGELIRQAQKSEEAMCSGHWKAIPMLLILMRQFLNISCKNESTEYTSVYKHKVW